MWDISAILEGKRNEIIYDVEWDNYRNLPAMNPSTLVKGLAPEGSLKSLLWEWDHMGAPAQKAPAGPLVWGRAAHALLFEPDTFQYRYMLWKDGRRAGKEYDKFAADANAVGAEVFNQAQWDSVLAAGKSFAECEAVKPLISSGKPEVTLLTTEDVEYENEKGELLKVSVAMKHRLDWVDGTAGIIDLKSTRCASQRAFSADVFRYAYDVKLGLYQRALRKLTGINRPVTIIVLEKKAPWEVSIMPIPDAVLENGARKGLEVLREVVKGIKTGKWPGKSETELTLSVPTWEMDDDVEYDA